MALNFNSKQFIKEIQNRPCLWNVNVQEYSDKIARQCAWQEIAEIMYKNWPDWEDKEKSTKLRDLQKKWKGLRDYFTREHNKGWKIKGENETYKRRNTPFLDMLSFLTKNNKRTKKRPHYTSQEYVPKETNLETNLENTIKPSQKYPVPVTQQSSSQEMIEIQKEDQDLNFLLSILPDMKSMSPYQNFEFRFEVMTLIKNMKYHPSSAHSYYSTPGSSAFGHPVTEYKPYLDVEVDLTTNESAVSSPEDTNSKPLLENSPNSRLSKDLFTH